MKIKDMLPEGPSTFMSTSRSILLGNINGLDKFCAANQKVFYVH